MFTETDLAINVGLGALHPDVACGTDAPDFEVFPALGGSVNRYDIALTITPM